MADRTTTPADPAATPLTGVRAAADRAFMWGLALFLLAGVVQIFLAGMGIFDLDGAATAEVAATGSTAD